VLARAMVDYYACEISRLYAEPADSYIRGLSRLYSMSGDSSDPLFQAEKDGRIALERLKVLDGRYDACQREQDAAWRCR
jgi:hypothetical protein